jgi:hypothetical protein
MYTTVICAYYIYNVDVWPGAGVGIKVSLKLASIGAYIYIPEYELRRMRCRICKISPRKFTYLRPTLKAYTYEGLELEYHGRL